MKTWSYFCIIEKIVIWEMRNIVKSIFIENSIFQLNKVIELEKEWIFKADEMKCIEMTQKAKRPYKLSTGKSCFCVSKEKYQKHEWERAIKECCSKSLRNSVLGNPCDFYNKTYYYEEKNEDNIYYQGMYPAEDFSLEKDFANAKGMYMYISEKLDVRLGEIKMIRTCRKINGTKINRVSSFEYTYEQLFN